ncbi:MAG: helix-turn-helix transcriptional regulator [Candidatus Aminicenantes bacterium]|jgi:DNA-binding PadR family transcriptional regulator
MKDLTKIEEILLLSIWELKDEAYGFKIRHHVSDIIGKDFTYGNLYSALDRLTRKKYVSKRTGESTPQRRGKTRMYYTISSSGIEALKAACAMNQKLWGTLKSYSFETNKK